MKGKAMDNLLFGAAYYEEYIPYADTAERLDTDMKMMKAAGFNVIRIAESTWATEEPKPGVYDFARVDRAIDAAERYGISVIIGTPTYAVPTWLYHLDPEVLATTREGKEKYGRRQNMDIVNPTYRHYAEGVIRALVSHVSGRKNVIGYQLDNETKHYDTTGPYVVKLFQQWMEQRYASVEEMNLALGLNYWSNAVTSFEELPDPSGSINASYIAEFDRFRRKLAADFLKWQRGIIDEYRREDQFVTHNFDYNWIGHSWGVQGGICHWEASDAVTLMGTDIYCPAQDALTGREIGFGGDLMRPLKKDRYLVLESQSQGFKNWTPYPGQLKLMTFSHIASGACGVMYWNWISIHNAIESYWKGILSHDLKGGRIYDEVSEIGELFQKLTPELSGLKKENRIAVVVNTESVNSLEYFKTDDSFSYNDGVHWVYDALYDMNAECDVIFAEETDLSAYSLLIFPSLYTIPEGLTERVREFVKGGGTVFSTFRSFFTDDRVKIFSDAQPHDLTDVFGMTYQEFAEPVNVTVEGEIASYWMELLMPGTAEEVSGYEHQYWGEYAAVTRNQYGKGYAWYLGTHVPERKLQDYLRKAMEDAGIGSSPIGFPVIVRKAVSKEGSPITFVFNYSSENLEITAPVSGTDLLTGEKVTEGENLTLKDWGARIIRS